MSAYPPRPILLLTAVVGVLVSPPLAATELFVKPTGAGLACTQPAPCTLPTALAGASSGDTLYVGAGTYTGTGDVVVALGMPLELLGGWNGAASGAVRRDPVAFESILDGQNQRQVIRVTGSTSPLIDGFTITRGNGSSAPACRDANGNPADGCGGGIWVYESHPRITNNRIVGNTAAPIVEGHSGVGAGGGIYLGSSPGTTLRDNLIAGNVASAVGEGYGGGVAILDDSEGTFVENNRIVDNAATTAPGMSGSGGGVLLASSDQGTWVTGNMLKGNAAGANDVGAGFFVFDGHAAFSHNCVLYAGDGRAVVFERSSGTLIGNRIQSYGTGTALSLLRSGEIDVINNVVAGASFAVEVDGETGESLSVELLHNTIVGTGASYGLWAGNYATVTARNNILASFHTVQGFDGTASLTLDHTLFFANVLDGERGSDPIAGDPLFVNAPRGDYHIQPGSAAIAAAADAGIAWDLDGDSRPGSGSFDVGADELAPWAFDFGTASSPLVAGWTRVTHATAFSPAQGYGWLSGTIASRDRGGPDDLRRDFAFTPLGTFAVAVPNGRYLVEVTLGDQTAGHNQMGVFLEGVLAESVTTAAGEFRTVSAEVSVTDWQLTLLLDDLGGGDPNVVLAALQLRRALPVRLDFGTTASPIAGGYRRVAHTGAYSAAAGWGWAGGVVQSRDRGTADPLLRDLDFTPRGLLSAFLTNGFYEVLLTQGDAASAHDQMGAFLQGAPAAPVTTAKNQFVTGRHCACVADNRLDLLLDDLGGGDPNVVVNALEVAAPPLLWFDFGTPTSPVAAGFLPVSHTTTYAASRGYGWSSGTVASRDRGTGSDLDRDLNFTRDAEFLVDLLRGRYQVTFTLGDAAAAHDEMEISLEGGFAGTFSTPAGQFVPQTYTVEVTDGQLAIRIRDVGGADASAVINALRIR